MREQTALGRAQTRRAFIGQGAFAFLAAAGMGHRAFGATEPPPNKVPTERGRRFRFAVAPANSFGGHGKAIRSDWLTGNFGA